ncbi:hypothetical protein U1Q18_021548 [Sarracenia purpurea var. burkii]
MVTTMVPMAEAAGECSENLGRCNSVRECSAKCKARHPKGYSRCVLSLSCTCFFPCRNKKPPRHGRPHPLPPLPPKPPTGGGGTQAKV